MPRPITLARICFALGIFVGSWILLNQNITKAMALTAIIVAAVVWIRGD